MKTTFKLIALLALSGCDGVMHFPPFSIIPVDSTCTPWAWSGLASIEIAAPDNCASIHENFVLATSILLAHGVLDKDELDTAFADTRIYIADTQTIMLESVKTIGYTYVNTVKSDSPGVRTYSDMYLASNMRALCHELLHILDIRKFDTTPADSASHKEWYHNHFFEMQDEYERIMIRAR